MNYLHILVLIVIVSAQDIITVLPLANVSELSRPIAQAFININTSTIALDQSILAFQGISQVGPLTQASTNLLNVLRQSTIDVAAVPFLGNGDAGELAATDLTTYVGSLAYYVNQTIFDLIAKKQLFVDICVGMVVREQVSQQNESSIEFQDTVLSKIPTSLLGLASNLAAPIATYLGSAVSAFADQTTLPASCIVTITSPTTTTGTTSTGSSTGSSSSSSSQPTIGSYPTSNSLPTSTTYPSVGSYSTSTSHSTSGSYPTSNIYPSSSPTSTSSPYISPPPGSSYSAGGSGVGTSSSYSLPIYTTGSTTSKVFIYTTTGKSPIQTYTGAAVINNAPSLIAFLVAIGVLAVL